jgi:antitoxin MazE
MRVLKWGNSLAVRLPSDLVEALDLKENDQIEIRVLGTRKVEIIRDLSVENALERIRHLRRPLPPAFKFDRWTANER